MEKLLQTGKVKAIGICNYSKRYLEELLPHVSITPAVNQIENHPSLPQQEIVDLCKSRGIHTTAYSPLGSSGSPLFKAEPVLAIAKKREVPVASVLLSYHGKCPTRCLFSLKEPALIFSSRTRQFRPRQVSHAVAH